MSNANEWRHNLETRVVARTGTLILGQHTRSAEMLVAKNGDSTRWTPLATFETTDWLDDDTARFWRENHLPKTKATP